MAALFLLCRTFPLQTERVSHSGACYLQPGFHHPQTAICAMMEKGNDWFELREFAGVDLLQSFVLSWEHAFGTLKIDIDLCLLPDHAFYEDPRPSEGACIRPAMLEFPLCTSLKSQSKTSESLEMPALASSLPHGRIEGLERIGEELYVIRGRFGEVTIGSERPLVRLKGSGP